jgi:hypothetical protein
VKKRFVHLWPNVISSLNLTVNKLVETFKLKVFGVYLSQRCLPKAADEWHKMSSFAQSCKGDLTNDRYKTSKIQVINFEDSYNYISWKIVSNQSISRIIAAYTDEFSFTIKCLIA